MTTLESRVTYTVSASIRIDVHRENIAHFAKVLTAGGEFFGVPGGGTPDYVGADDGSLTASWNFTDATFAEQFHTKLLDMGVCGMTLDLTMGTWWTHEHDDDD